jgi:hypothetical protein
MTKQESLEIIKLLSAVESWSLADNHRMPDYLMEKLVDAIEILTKKVLE